MSPDCDTWPLAGPGMWRGLCSESPGWALLASRHVNLGYRTVWRAASPSHWELRPLPKHTASFGLSTWWGATKFEGQRMGLPLIHRSYHLVFANLLWLPSPRDPRPACQQLSWPKFSGARLLLCFSQSSEGTEPPEAKAQHPSPGQPSAHKRKPGWWSQYLGLQECICIF